MPEPDNHEYDIVVCPRCERHVCRECGCACDSYGYPPKGSREPVSGFIKTLVRSHDEGSTMPEGQS